MTYKGHGLPPQRSIGFARRYSFLILPLLPTLRRR
jgi:hypothetical protein